MFSLWALASVSGLILLLGRGITVNSDKPSYDDLFKKYASKYGLDWQILKAIAVVESSLGQAPSVLRGLANANDVDGSKSTDGKSWGLMQVTLTTAKDYDSFATPQKLNNPDYSVDLAAQHLKMLEGLFDKSDPRYREWVIKSYNQGQGNTLKEKQGKIPTGYANDYWKKYLAAYKKVVGF